MPRSTRSAGERGSGTLGTALAVAVMIGGIGVAANVTIGLWARTTVESVAYDTARRIAETPAGADPRRHAEAALANARRSLGPLVADVDLDLVDPGADHVGVRVRYGGVRLVPRLLDGGPVVGSIDRTITVRRERVK